MEKLKKEQTTRDMNTKLNGLDGDIRPPAVIINFEKYAHHLEDLNLSDEEKRELLQMLWNIACEFVALGYNVHPLQAAQNACGKEPETAGKLPIPDQNDVSLLGQFIKENLAAQTDPNPDRAGKDSIHETVN